MEAPVVGSGGGGGGCGEGGVGGTGYKEEEGVRRLGCRWDSGGAIFGNGGGE